MWSGRAPRREYNLPLDAAMSCCWLRGGGRRTAAKRQPDLDERGTACRDRGGREISSRRSLGDMIQCLIECHCLNPMAISYLLYSFKSYRFADWSNSKKHAYLVLFTHSQDTQMTHYWGQFANQYRKKKFLELNIVPWFLFTDRRRQAYV